MHKCQQYLKKVFNNAQRTLQIILAFEKQYKDIGYQESQYVTSVIELVVPTFSLLFASIIQCARL
jgi:hypothetical protein